MSKMKYELLAIDVDGTLVGPDQVVPAETVAAIAAADEAGLRVCLATGRSYVETMPIWRQLRLRPPLEPMVLVGGALVSEPDSGRTLYQRTIDLALACEFGDALNEAGYSAMALVDAWRQGVDYYFTEGSDAQRTAQRWFGQMDVKVRRVPRLREAGDLREPLRVSVVAEGDAAEALVADLYERFDGRLNIHAILAPNYDVTIVEGFAAKTSKLSGVQYVAQSHQTALGKVAAVGDDINDVPIVRGAGLGVAMPQSPQSLRDVADHVAEDGLAQFIHQLLDGQFD